MILLSIDAFEICTRTQISAGGAAQIICDRHAGECSVFMYPISNHVFDLQKNIRSILGERDFYHASKNLVNTFFRKSFRRLKMSVSKWLQIDGPFAVAKLYRANIFGHGADACYIAIFEQRKFFFRDGEKQFKIFTAVQSE